MTTKDKRKSKNNNAALDLQSPDLEELSPEAAELESVLESVVEGNDSEDLSAEADSSAADGEVVNAVPLIAQVSALLFVSSRPIRTASLAEATRADEEAVLQAIEQLRETFQEEQFGFVIQEIAGGWQLRSGPRLAPVISRFLNPRGRRLSAAAAETLAVVAYKQPVQKADIEAIRGVDALPTLKTLLDLRLIRIVGKELSPGQPVLYGTTKSFLEKFGLRDLSELPSVREIERLVSEPGETQDLEPREESEGLSDSVDEAGEREDLELQAAQDG